MYTRGRDYNCWKRVDRGMVLPFGTPRTSVFFKNGINFLEKVRDLR